MTCTRCNGTGWLFYEDSPSPAGVSLAPGAMSFADPCPDCLEQGICPACGNPLGEPYNDDNDCRCECGYDSEAACDAGPVYDERDLDTDGPEDY